MSTQPPIRILLYSHDSFGLGHLRRSLSIAAALGRSNPNVSVVILTGSPTPDLFELPPHCEIVKIPSITKDAEGEYVSRNLPMPCAEILGIRTAIITAMVRSFQPDLFLVDHTPTGPGDELLPVLRRIRHEAARTRVVLGIRDIIDAPHLARAQLHRNGAISALRNHYDEILVYSDRSLLDACTEYRLPTDLCQKFNYVGFVCPSPPAQTPQATNGSAVKLLATAGGGEDGYELLRSVVAALRGPMRQMDCSVTLVAGPLMRPDEIRSLKKARQGDTRLRILERARNMSSLIANASLVIGMGGYNTVFETLSHARRLLALPRTHPRREQHERCRRLSEMGLLEMLSRDESAEPLSMASAIEGALSRPGIESCHLPFDGAERAAERLLAGLQTCEDTPRMKSAERG